MLITLDEIEYLCGKYKLSYQHFKNRHYNANIALFVSSTIFDYKTQTIFLARHVHKNCYRIYQESMRIDFYYGFSKKTPLYLKLTKLHTFFKELDLDLEKLMNQIRLNEQYRKELYFERKREEMEADFDCQ